MSCSCPLVAVVALPDSLRCGVLLFAIFWFFWFCFPQASPFFRCLSPLCWFLRFCGLFLSRLMSSGGNICAGEKKKWNKKLKHKHHFLPPFSFSSLPSFYFISSPFMSYVAATCPSRRPSFKHLVLNFSLRLRSKPWLCSVNTASSPYCFKVACRSLNVWRTRI